jgi:pimeloyl-ACP methyl ester carboxylesterase
VLAGPGFPVDDAFIAERAARSFDRGLNPAGTARQMAAILASGSRKEALLQVSAPTLVIHGDADPLVPVEGGIDTAESIPGAKLLIIEGMGHDLPPSLASRVIDAIVEHAK